MSEEDLEAKIQELEAKIRKQNSAISEYLDKIESLEDTIMELEESFLDQSDMENTSFLKLRLKDLEAENREMKDKLSLSKLESVKLKRKLEEVKKGKLIDASLIKVMDDSSDSELTSLKTRVTGSGESSQKEQFRYMEIKCPECETHKNLSIPVKIIHQGHQLTTLSIPKGMVCEHKFQVLFDKSLSVKRYQVTDFDIPHLEYYESNIVEGSDNINKSTSLPFSKEIIALIRDSIDNRDILGAAIFTEKRKVKYASIPSDVLFNVIEEFEVRREKQLQEIDKMFLELKNHQKIYSEHINIQEIEYYLVLILARKVNFGMGSMLFGNIKKKIITITSKS